MISEDEVTRNLVPHIARLAGPVRIVIGIGGSRAKGLRDAHSDYDFRLYADQFCSAPGDVHDQPEYRHFGDAMQQWEDRGLRIDGTWQRLIGVIDAEVDQWLAGTAQPTVLDWAVWGYYRPTDLLHQRIIRDPDGVMSGWKLRLAQYPDALHDRLLAENIALLRYRRGYHHYESKVLRGDLVYLSGLSSRLVHAIVQVVFALDRTWFPGDGRTLQLVAGLPVQPPDRTALITAILALPNPATQRDMLIPLIDDLIPLTV